MTRLSEHLYMIKDTCNCYAVIAHGATLLIDCGTHVQPDTIHELGLPPVEFLLITHYHRDQCSGAKTFQDSGTRIILPYAESRFLEEPDLLKASYYTYNNYNSYYPAFGPLDDLVADDYAHDHGTIVWQGIPFQVVPMPGHTFGSVGFEFTCDGSSVLACGDLMSAPGKLHQYYSTQWEYMNFKGHVNHMESLMAVESAKPELVLPGHGEPFTYTDQAVRDLRRPLEELYHLFHGRAYSYFRPSFRRVSGHVVEVTNSVASSYVIHDDGHALMIDSGYVSNAMIAANPHRYIDALTPFLKSELGIRNVEWFIPTHYHDDHLAGYPALKLKYGTKVVVSWELVELVEHPDRFGMPCTLSQPLTVSHVVHRGEAFHWRGIEFHIEQHPGQTWYHHLIRFEVDGLKYLSIGDNISGVNFREERDYIHSFIPKSRTPVTSYGSMPRQVLEADPDILLTGRGGAVPSDPEKMERWKSWMDRWQSLLTGIIDQPTPDMGMDPHWVVFKPFKIRIKPGQTVQFKLTVRNHEDEDRTFQVTFRSVQGVILEPASRGIVAPRNSDRAVTLSATFFTSFTTHSLPVLADVTWNGRCLGEVAEAVAYR